MSANSASLKKTVTRESALFLCLMFIGLVILPYAVYLVGKSVFGEYGGTGFSDFYIALHRSIRDGEAAILFLVFSPYLIWQLARLTIWGFRQSLRRRQQV
jgi:uncharacterized membrane protein